MRGLLLVALVACGGETKPRPTAPDPAPTHQVSGSRIDPTSTTVPSVWAEASGPKTCADPDLRTADHFRRLQAPALPTTERSLWGAGMIAGDLTGDGAHDLLLLGETEHQLWVPRPNDDPEAVDLLPVAAPWLETLDLDFAVGGTAVDLDADGHLDLVITRWARPNLLLRNTGAGDFVDITPPAMFAASNRTQSVSVADFDGDGDLDLFFGNYGDDPVAFDAPMPPADPAELYRNDAGTWTDVSDQLPPEAHDGYTFSSAAVDLDGDGLAELALSNDFGVIRPSVLLWNRGGLDFDVDLGWHPGVEDMGMAVGDLNADEVPDFLITSWRTLSLLLSGEASGVPKTWFDGAAAAGIQVIHEAPLRQDFGWGTELADLDNDADLDAVVLHGAWDTWPGDELEIDSLWIQTSGLAFEDHAARPEWDLADDRDGRSVVLVDLNGDGWLDVVKRGVDQVSRMALSHCGEEGWLRIELGAPAPNTRGIGAKVVVESGGQRQVRWIRAGTGLYTGQPPEAHFGLGPEDVVDAIEVHWPDGAVTVFEDVQTRQRIRVVRAI